jgi:hypothetical protein
MPDHGRGGAANQANSEEGLVTGPIRGFCALQARQSGGVRAGAFERLQRARRRRHRNGRLAAFVVAIPGSLVALRARKRAR